MTTIAFDGIRLAADRRFSCAGGMSSGTKIRKTKDGRLIGAAGDAGLCMLTLDWLSEPEKTRGPRPVPKSGDDDCEILEVFPDGRIFEYDKYGRYPNEDGIATIGSGRDYAKMAIHLGNDAPHAVKLAGLFDPSTSSDVDVLILKVKP
jgi:hypothetical protein